MTDDLDIPLDCKAVPFECSDRFALLMEAYWTEHERPVGPKPSGKQREFKPKKHKVRFNDGQPQPPRELNPYPMRGKRQ